MSSVGIREAAEMLNVSIPTIRNWINSGRLQAKKSLGNHGPEYRIDVDEIRRIKEEQPNKTIVIHQEQADPTLAVPSSWLLGQLTGSIKDIVKDVMKEEIEMMRVTMREEMQKELAIGEDRLAKRDQQLMEVLREIHTIRKQEAEQPVSFWSRLFRKQ